LLPIADRSAAILAEALLSDDSQTAIALLAEALVDDPPLAIWATCVACQGTASLPQTCAELATRVSSRLLDALMAAGAATRGSESDASESDASASDVLGASPSSDRFGRQVEDDLLLASLAAALAKKQGESAADAAYYEGLLCHAAQWRPVDEAAQSPSRLPNAPQSVLAPLASCSPYVQQAIDALQQSAEPPTAVNAKPMKACRRHAQEGRRRWLAPVRGVGRQLKALVRRLYELRESQTRFKEALEREKLEAMAELAAGAGHEVNNPLATIAGRAQLLLRDETDPERRRELSVINAQARRANEMIADMRLFARPPQPQREPLDLASLVRHVVEELAPQAKQRTIAIEVLAPQGSTDIEADATQMSVALHAILRNAIEAIHDAGRIELAVHGREAEVELRVSDTGTGIQPEHRRHIFDPFFSSRQAGRGLGMGLSKCWRIVTNHGGQIRVESEPGHGATFTITLPRRHAKDVEEERLGQTLQAEQPSLGP
jgi:signal transduction histidine kinase